MLVTDLVIREDFCNGKCIYCLTKSSQLKASHYRIKDNGPDMSSEAANEKYFKGEPLWSRLNKIIGNLNEYVDSPILKISGGEVLLIPGIVDFIRDVSPLYNRVQLLTNGTLLTDNIIKELSGIRNLHMQISLDSWSFEGNWARVQGNRDMHDAIIYGIESVAKKGISVEINCVLNKFNISHLISTVKSLSSIGGKVKIVPYPIRGNSQKEYLPEGNVNEVIGELVYLYSEYKNILPPKAYLLGLMEFFTNSRRTSRCILPLNLFQVFDDGIVVGCVNMWTVKTGNILIDEKNVLNNLGNEKIHQLLTENEPSLYCRGCYTPWDLINLFFEGKVTLNEIMEIPLYEGLESYFEKILGCLN